MKAFPNEFESAGMDLRDYFAAKAMQAFLPNAVCKTASDVKAICEDSYVLADAMMEARKK